ncbi:MAG: hypothetical protein IKX67_04125 [Bacteroidales bacterium]|nr:hypothetical protein [Bacteroidales bacterium]
MGLFDQDLIKTIVVPEPNYGQVLTIDHLYYTSRSICDKVTNLNNLDQAESEALYSFYEYNLSGDGLVRFIPTLLCRKGVAVEMSIQEVSFSGFDNPVDPYTKVDGSTVVLGEYIKDASCNERIILYVKNIRAAAKEHKIASSLLLNAVLAHELYHAFFHKDKYAPEIEEPLAEFGSLLYMNILRSCKITSYESIESLYHVIKGKGARNPNLKSYSLGADLFQETIHDPCIRKYIEMYEKFDINRLSFDLARQYNQIKDNPSVSNMKNLINGIMKEY